MDAKDAGGVPGTGRRLVISPLFTVRWAGAAVRLGAGPGSPAADLPEPSILGLIHAFASPRDPEAVIASVPPGNRETARRAIADFASAGFLVAAPETRSRPQPAVPAAGEVRASVIMPTRNKALYLDRTLATYRGQTDPRFEIVIVNDGSEDDTAAVAARHRETFPGVVLLERPHAGRAAARNAGLEAARGELVIFSDDDRLAPPEFIERHLAAQAANPGAVLGWMYGIVTVLERRLLGPLYDPLAQRLTAAGQAAAFGRDAVALVDPETLAADPARVFSELGTPEPDWEHKVAPALERYGPSLAGFALPWFLGSTGNLSVPRELALRAGGFDPGYTGYGMEDTDFCYALHRDGVPFSVCREGANYHQLHPKPDLSREMAASLAYFRAKYDDPGAHLFAHWFRGGVDLEAAEGMARRFEAGEDAGLAALMERLRG
jgi:glycosyltransferase involved in cell wall biosynthesis